MSVKCDSEVQLISFPKTNENQNGYFYLRKRSLISIERGQRVNTRRVGV